jgi:hypothetical protein
VDVKRRSTLIKTMRRYNQLGLRAWGGWAGQAVPLAQSPADVRTEPRTGAIA